MIINRIQLMTDGRRTNFTNDKSHQ